MVEHLVGLQAQENLPPYLSLAARLDGFDPHELSAALERGGAVRLLTMRGTIHVLTPRRRAGAAAVGAAGARPAEQEQPDEQAGSARAGGRPGRARPGGCWPREPLPVKELGERLARRLSRRPGRRARPRRARAGAAGAAAPARAVAALGRRGLPDRREPPRPADHRGRRPGAGAPLPPRVRPGHRRRHDGLVAGDPARPGVRGDARRARGRSRPRTAGGCTTYLARRSSTERPTHRSGCSATYDNVWLSHADRLRIMPTRPARRWMGSNGGVGRTVFVDGFLAGLWWWRDEQRRCSTCSAALPRPSSASSTTRSTGSPRCWPTDSCAEGHSRSDTPQQVGTGRSAPAGAGEQGGGGGDTGGRGAQHRGARAAPARRRRRRTRPAPRRRCRPRARPRSRSPRARAPAGRRAGRTRPRAARPARTPSTAARRRRRCRPSR